MEKKSICINTTAEKVKNSKNAQDIITQSHQFRTKYGNPHMGIPKAQDFDWYVLGRLDQLYDKQDENFKLIISKLENYQKDKVNKQTFWKVMGIFTVFMVALMGITVSNM